MFLYPQLQRHFRFSNGFLLLVQDNYDKAPSKEKNCHNFSSPVTFRN